ncbi:Non-reducing end alpha-L-arabinofuranosidase BoGH43A [Paramyrothecium foliicola]|nr:Non-reducing end alpha-L-arabinofuranosidase BoGH43A [Paramyrothecium foliicola]
MKLFNFSLGLLVTFGAQRCFAQTENSTFFNPVLPGWHSDPSCTRVDDTFYCVTSTFIAFPGLPVYASKDLINWRLISHAWNRESQLPGISWATEEQQQGMYAATIRYHDGEFFVICEYLGIPGGIIGVVFRTSDPFNDETWSDPVRFSADRIDPDLFWDDDGKVYVATHGILLQEFNLETGELSLPPVSVWNGTGGVWPEGECAVFINPTTELRTIGPHLYKRDGWYYLLIAEGGTELNHAVTIARSKDIWGPYESYVNNPILTNRGTDEYFQTVGHADLFTDVDGNWWGLALATRCGPEYTHYPMGREAVMFPVTWNEGEWPVLQPVRGEMSAWPLPAETRDVPGDGPFNEDPDEYYFNAGSTIPKHFVHWRVPREGVFSTTDAGLQIVPSRNNLTGIPFSKTEIELSGQRGLSFVGRRQTHTLFHFSVDVSFSPKEVGEEAGITVFLTQANHIDIGLVLLESGLSLRFNAIGTGGVHESKTVPVPEDWTKDPVRLHIYAEDPKSYRLAASHGCRKPISVATASAALVSGGNGTFVGSLVGAYATCNGAGIGVQCPDGEAPAFQRWAYKPIAQHITETEAIPSQ